MTDKGKLVVAAMLDLPIGIRLALLFVIGVLIGRQLNRGIYCLAWFPRELGPWSPPPADAPRRRALDRVPVLGWWGLRREAPWHGAGYWIRPLLIELATGIGFAVLYWGEVDQRWLWPTLPGLGAPASTTLHAQCLSHLILVSLMMVATFIDFDEQTIPDEITVTGAIVGLVLAVLLPAVALPTVYESSVGSASAHQIVLTSSTAAAGVAGRSGRPVLLARHPGSTCRPGPRSAGRLGLVLRDTPQDVDHAARHPESRSVHGGECCASPNLAAAGGPWRFLVADRLGDLDARAPRIGRVCCRRLSACVLEGD